MAAHFPAMVREFRKRLSEVPWATLSHAYGDAQDIPELLLTLFAGSDDAIDDARIELLGNIYHQGSVYSATPAAVDFLLDCFLRGERDAGVDAAGAVLAAIATAQPCAVHTQCLERIALRQSDLIGKLTWTSDEPTADAAAVMIAPLLPSPKVEEVFSLYATAKNDDDTQTATTILLAHLFWHGRSSTPLPAASAFADPRLRFLLSLAHAPERSIDWQSDEARAVYSLPFPDIWSGEFDGVEGVIWSLLQRTPQRLLDWSLYLWQSGHKYAHYYLMDTVDLYRSASRDLLAYFAQHGVFDTRQKHAISAILACGFAAKNTIESLPLRPDNRQAALRAWQANYDAASAIALPYWDQVVESRGDELAIINQPEPTHHEKLDERKKALIALSRKATLTTNERDAVERELLRQDRWLRVYASHALITHAQQQPCDAAVDALVPLLGASRLGLCAARLLRQAPRLTESATAHINTLLACDERPAVGGACGQIAYLDDALCRELQAALDHADD